MNQEEVEYISSLYGGFWELDIKDFCYMTNSYFPPEELLASLGTMSRTLISSYPATNWYVSSQLAEPLGLSHEQLVIGNGASELINAITSLYVQKLAVPVPTFNEYINRAEGQGKQVFPYPLSDDFELDVDGFIKFVNDQGANAALLIRPNNPTGTYVKKGDLEHLLESLRGLDLVLVDESFIDFVDVEHDPSALDRVNEYPNLIILKSLSKNYGVPGLRLGYAVSGDTGRVAELRQALPIWNINSLAQYFVSRVGVYSAQLQDSYKNTREATQALFQKLQKVPYIHPYPTQANFILCRVKNGLSGADLTASLFKQHRMFLNECSNKHGLGGHFVRIASRTAEENDELIQAMLELGATLQANSSRTAV